MEGSGLMHTPSDYVVGDTKAPKGQEFLAENDDDDYVVGLYWGRIAIAAVITAGLAIALLVALL